jgi:hypothetical protein
VDVDEIGHLSAQMVEIFIFIFKKNFLVTGFESFDGRIWAIVPGPITDVLMDGNFPSSKVSLVPPGRTE